MKSAGKARNNGLYRHIRTSKEIIRNLLNDFNNVSKNQYDKAFEIALSAYQSYTLNELDEFFRKSPPVYNMVGISGSGGSNIAKPNIGTLTAYHLAKIFQVENFNISIVKFGSRKRTSVSGSVDFGETINSIPFKLVDDSCFIKKLINILSTDRWKKSCQISFVEVSFSSSNMHTCVFWIRFSLYTRKNIIGRLNFTQ